MLAFHDREGVWPTVREICDEFDYASTNAAHAHLAALKKKGWVRQRPRCARGWIAVRQEPDNEDQ
jgi:SOS-response transcriptional repressor LexA